MKQRGWVIWLASLLAILILSLVFNRSPKKAPPADRNGVPPKLSTHSGAPGSPATPQLTPTNTASAGDAAVPETPETAPSNSAPAAASSPNQASGETRLQNPSGLPPVTILQNLRSTFHQYASVFGGNPVGTNPEITKALNGGNSRQMNFVREEEGFRINGNGELVDPWGTPYFFHQLSGKEMEIHSAGPDRKMWTDDDLVTR